MPKAHHRSSRNAKPTPGFRGRIWIDGSEGTFIGYGRVILLERIREQGSITKASKSMQMAYRHAWDLVDSMNRQAKEPLVEMAKAAREAAARGSRRRANARSSGSGVSMMISSHS